MSRLRVHLRSPVPWGAVAVSYVVAVVAAAVAAWTIVNIGDQAARTDREINRARVGNIYANCEQSNFTKEPVARLVETSLRVPSRPDIPAATALRIRRAFVEELRKLQPYDCATQRRKLDAAHRVGDYEVTVPYCVTYRGYDPSMRPLTCPPAPKIEVDERSP